VPYAVGIGSHCDGNDLLDALDSTKGVALQAPESTHLRLPTGSDSARVFTRADTMIQKYSDHAANERTFLAWIRTGIAVIAFGFVVEKFNLFMIVLVSTLSPEAASRLWIDRLTKPFGRYDGIALVVVGVGVIFVAALRFYRTAKLIDDPEPRPALDTRVELAFSAILALLTTGLCVYLVLS
jgi:putative membrane protein